MFAVTAAHGESNLLKIGSKGDAVLEVQQLLKAQGCYSGELDGDFGSGTEQAVKDFQKKQGLTADGVVGPQTMAALQRAGSATTVRTSRGALPNRALPGSRETSGQLAASETEQSSASEEVQQAANETTQYSVTEMIQLAIDEAIQSTTSNNPSSSALEALPAPAVPLSGAAVEEQDPVVMEEQEQPEEDLPASDEEEEAALRKAEIVKAQQLLQLYGYYTGELDGIVGTKTQRAIRYFQDDCDLEVDGVIGAQTLTALENFDPATVVKKDRSALEMQKGQELVEYAKQFLGTPYSYGGMSPRGFDCSGFTTYVYKQFGISLSRTSYDQFGNGYAVTDLQPGDLVFFTTLSSGASHVGIYMGDGSFIHASSGASKVVVTSMSSSYYSPRYLGARRVID